MRRINIGIIVYLEDMLLMGRILEEKLTAKYTLIFLLQYLGFVKNLKKLILQPVNQLQFWGLHINAEQMTLFLSERETGSYNSTMGHPCFNKTSSSFPD